MSRDPLLVERLEDVLEALERIPRRFAGIKTPEDFYDTPEGQDRLDAICMVRVAVGEAFKQVDRQTDGKLLARYPGVKGVRDVIAHGYFDVDAEEVFAICQKISRCSLRPFGPCSTTSPMIPRADSQDV